MKGSSQVDLPTKTEVPNRGGEGVRGRGGERQSGRERLSLKVPNNPGERGGCVTRLLWTSF